jgi:hypothetical protein
MYGVRPNLRKGRTSYTVQGRAYKCTLGPQQRGSQGFGVLAGAPTAAPSDASPRACINGLPLGRVPVKVIRKLSER